MYGPYTNEELVGRAIKGEARRVVIATKFGIVRDPNDRTQARRQRPPEYVRASCEGSLKRLGVDTIDLYYQHRVDPNTPIEDTVGAMADLVREGKVRYIGLSEAGPETLRRAHAVHPISALQTEYSLWSRDPKDEIIPACRTLGIGFVAYSPARPRLSHRASTRASRTFAPTTSGATRPAFRARTSRRISSSSRTSRRSRRRRGARRRSSRSPGCWRRGRTSCPFPAPSTASISRRTSARSASRSAAPTCDRIDEIAPKGAAAGDRYHAEAMKLIGR